ncbi:ABC transporter permease [Streptacidiphilus jiangxiensis]|uniref:Putative ABC transport system permease protein n=1 Tax=Streptacidiphilus jiangxiensis TaxID=235985 RepID=A0A1H7ZYH1_STRJI|nr:ABC transporter permease [Streptacidiphilus jiangxiensis]SEM62764.1 putative ABC transport system permease protein [Streptacidiphilus jiangxiensis]
MTVLRTSLRNFLAHKGRMALSAVAVLLSVAFVCGTLVFTDTMNTTFDKLFATSASDVTVSPAKVDNAQQTGTPDSLPASLQAGLARVPGVAAVVPEVTSQQATVADSHNQDIGSTTGAPTIVANWNPTRTRTVGITSGHVPLAPGDAVLDADTAAEHHLRIGDTLRVIAGPGDFKVTVTGIATFKTTNPGAAVLYLDTPTAQQGLLGSRTAYTDFALDAAPGVSDDQLKARVDAAIGHGYQVQTAAELKAQNQKDIGSFLGPMKDVLLGFAGIAVLVGVFLIVNTFSMLVAQRTREIGLMRAIGSSRRQVNRAVLVEAVLLGVVGSVAGIGAGIGLAVGLMKLMGAFGMHLTTADLTIKAATPLIGLTVGVVVTVVSAMLPARRAGAISPMAAMRDAGTPADARAGRVRAALGVLLTAAGGTALALAATASSASAGSGLLAIGVLLTLVGFVVVGPLLAGIVVRILGAVTLRWFGPVGRLAERNALRNPRRTGATAAALMIGLALVAGLSVVGDSMVASATAQMDRSVGADFIIQAGNGNPISPAAAKAIHAAGHLAHVTDRTDVVATVTAPDGTKDRTVIAAATPSYTDDLQARTVQGRLIDAYAPGAMSVPEGWAKAHKVALGDRLDVAFTSGRTARLTVNAITSDDTVFDKGAMYMNIADARTYLPADRFPANDMMFAAALPGQQSQAAAALKAATADYPQVKVRDQADYKNMIQQQLDQLLNMIYALLALAIVVAVLGVVNTLALSVVERTREIGLMRAIGLSRRQLRRMVRLESVVIALFGAVLGVGLGMGWGVAAQKLLALSGLGVLSIPWTTIGVVFLGSALVGLLAALFPAFRAGRMNILKAVATD